MYLFLFYLLLIIAKIFVVVFLDTFHAVKVIENTELYLSRLILFGKYVMTLSMISQTILNLYSV